MTAKRIQAAKSVAKTYQRAFDSAAVGNLTDVLARFTSGDFLWRGVHPFNEQRGAAAVSDVFWRPLRESVGSLQRREDLFIAGLNDVDDGQSVWVVSMGHMMGLFDRDWLGIPATGRLSFLRYAEFHRIAQERIQESAMFCDLIGLMHQAGHYPLPPPTGAEFIRPGPRGNDGVLLEPQDSAESSATMQLVNRMIAELHALNESGNDDCSPEVLARTWHDDMAWYGPGGIGSTYTIRRYQQQHQYPFRRHLKDKVFNGHVARIAEGRFAGFFGWANLTNTATGGFLGLPGSKRPADMRIVDIYRREGSKLAENWVFIDLLHYLSMQGLDVLGRLRELRGSGLLGRG